LQGRKFFGQVGADYIKQHCVPLVLTGGNMIQIQTATGKVLEAPSPIANSEFFPALEAFRRLPAEERKPKSVPADTFYRLPPPPNGLVFRVYTRGLERDASGRLQPIAKQSQDYQGPNRDFLWVTEAEWKSLVPDRLAPGVHLAVPDPIARRIFCYNLIDNTAGIAPVWEPGAVRAGALSVTVQEATASACRLKLEGAVRMSDDQDFAKATRKGEFAFLGFLDYDPNNKKFTGATVIALEDYHSSSLTLGVAFELASPGSLGYGTVPFGLWSGVNSCRPADPQVTTYFGTNPYPAKKN
jgi:hypothetical protein